jgi:glycogen phosphorylase
MNTETLEALAPEVDGDLDAHALAREIVARLTYRIGKSPRSAQPHDWLEAAILVTRDRLIHPWMESRRQAFQKQEKRVYYLSLEFLIGRLFRDAVSNLGLLDTMRAALAELDVDFDDLVGLEPDAALGNGGLGRLAACFMESMATVGIPAYGYGIRYRHGLFHQEIRDGWQLEFPETWLEHGNPWEFDRRDSRLHGRLRRLRGLAREPRRPALHLEPGRAPHRHRLRHAGGRLEGGAGEHVAAVEGRAARSDRPRRLQRRRPHRLADGVEPRRRSDPRPLSRRRIAFGAGAAAAAGILLLVGLAAGHRRRHLALYPTVDNLHEKASIQLNDTHPAICVPELMRILMDEHLVPFERAWEITKGTISYTNHTLLPEALESWPLPLLERLLPRPMQIIYDINARLIREAAQTHDFDNEAIRAISSSTRTASAGCGWATSPSSAPTRSTASRRSTPT